MADAEFKHPKPPVKWGTGLALISWAVLLAFGGLLVLGMYIDKFKPAIPVSAHAEPATLTPAMQKCLSENVLVAVVAMGFAEARAERHVGEDIGKARATAWFDAFELKCDLRRHEMWAARDYLVAEAKRGH
jgi:hypothetical protein